MLTGGTIWISTHGHMKVFFKVGDPFLVDVFEGTNKQTPTWRGPIPMLRNAHIQPGPKTLRQSTHRRRS